MSTIGNGSPPRPKLLVTGGSGSLGREIVRQAVASWDVTATYWANPDAIPAQSQGIAPVKLDLRDSAAVARCLDRIRPQAVIHTAGSDRCDDFYRLIVDGTRHVAQEVYRHGARLVNLSTDVVFDGEHAPYAESAPPAPLHMYGRAKAEAEVTVADSQADAVTVRTSLIYSVLGDDHISRWLLKANASGEPVILFTDEWRCPVWVQHLAAACLELAHHPYRGVLNVAGPQRVNRWELGQRLMVALGERMGANIRPGPTPDSLRSSRPRDCTLEVTLAGRLLQRPVLGLDQVLSRTHRVDRPSGGKRGAPAPRSRHVLDYTG